MVTAVGGRLPQQGRPPAQLPIPEGLWQQLALGLWQQHDAEDAQEGAGRQDHMLQEGPVAHVEALSWATQPPERPKCHDKAQATAPEKHGEGTEPIAVSLTSALLQQLLFSILHPFTSAKGLKAWLAPPLPLPSPPLLPDSGGDDFRSQEGTEDGRSLGGEESKDREGCDGSIVQIWRPKRIYEWGRGAHTWPSLGC